MTDRLEKIDAANNMLTCARFLGLMNSSAKNWFQTVDNLEQIHLLLDQRSAAKQSKNWQLADGIRNELSAIGIVIEDKSDGTTSWKKT